MCFRLEMMPYLLPGVNHVIINPHNLLNLHNKSDAYYS